jgi:hypothetical protein
VCSWGGGEFGLPERKIREGYAKGAKEDTERKAKFNKKMKIISSNSRKNFLNYFCIFFASFA